MIRTLLVATALLLQVAATRPPQGGSVSGILRTSQGLRLAEIPVAVVPADDSHLDLSKIPETSGVTNNQGEYLLSNIPPGRYRVVTGRLGSISYHPGVRDVNLATIIVVSAGSSAHLTDVVFPRVKVSGRVVDVQTGKGRGIGSLSLCCQYSSNLATPAEARSIVVEYSPIAASIRDDGTFSFLSVPPGNYFFQVFDSGFVPFAQPIAITDQDMTGIELAISPPMRFQGALVDQKGRPIPFVSITVKAQSGNTRFEMPSSAPDLGGTMIFENANRNDPNLFYPSLEEIRNRLIDMFPSEAESTDTDGAFKFSRIFPGKYTLEVRAPKAGSTRRNFEVGPSQPDVRIELPIAQLAGKVVMEDGGPLLPILGTVRIYSTTEGSQVLYISPDAQGRFFLLMEPGEYRVRAEHLIPNHEIRSITDGTNDLINQPFQFSEANPPEILITVAR